jgi:hypothetical protein
VNTLLPATVYVFTRFAECTEYELRIKWDYSGKKWKCSVFCEVETEFSYLLATRGLEPISYGGALLSTLLCATVYVFTVR